LAALRAVRRVAVKAAPLAQQKVDRLAGHWVAT
jgi:hypothetical protein